MRKSELVVSAIAVFCLTVEAAILCINRGEGPFYKGRRLTVWLGEYDHNWQEADQAVRSLGTNALPTVMDLLTRNDTDPSGAISACKSLGPLASPAFPLLTNLYNDGGCQVLIPDTLVALRTQEALAFVTNGLTDKFINGRIICAGALEWAGPSASNAIPLLISCTTNGDEQLRGTAARALGGIGTDLDEVIPVLTNLLHDASPWVRRDAIWALGQFGEQATSAVPALVEKLEDPEEHVRFLARAWLHEIDRDFRKRLGEDTKER